MVDIDHGSQFPVQQKSHHTLMAAPNCSKQWPAVAVPVGLGDLLPKFLRVNENGGWHIFVLPMHFRRRACGVMWAVAWAATIERHFAVTHRRVRFGLQEQFDHLKVVVQNKKVASSGSTQSDADENDPAGYASFRTW